MKLSESLKATVIDLWEEAAKKPFVTAMAEGTLSQSLFRNYMIQDYLYLQDYIELLQDMRKRNTDASVDDFLQAAIEETEEELEHVHIPNMKKLGIEDREIKTCHKSQVIIDYIAYMQKSVKTQGLLAGLTALLQCSWIYFFIGQSIDAAYHDAISRSPYRSWFEAYISKDYIRANQSWIDMVDRKAAGINQAERDRLCQVFKTCAKYENKLWDALFQA